jgi:hypothetical protein
MIDLAKEVQRLQAQLQQYQENDTSLLSSSQMSESAGKAEPVSAPIDIAMLDPLTQSQGGASQSQSQSVSLGVRVFAIRYEGLHTLVKLIERLLQYAAVTAVDE